MPVPDNVNVFDCSVPVKDEVPPLRPLNHLSPVLSTVTSFTASSVTTPLALKAVEFGEDVEKKIRQTLQAQLTRLDLVSREEFDVQTQVLLRTREKLALLEQRISELEARNNSVADLQSPPAIPPIDKAE